MTNGIRTCRDELVRVLDTRVPEDRNSDESAPPMAYDENLGVEMHEPHIDIWSIPLNPPDCESFPESILSPEERSRASRFRFEKHARRFRVRHAALRLVLQHYLGQPAKTIRFSTTARGKPFIADATPVRFNLSHSDDLALVAVSSEAEIGVDVEAIQPRFSVEEMTSCFVRTEREIINQAPSAEARSAAFFRLWTRKEAVLKADGSGLAAGLQNIDVSRVPLELARVETSAPRLWRVEDLNVAPGYAAALAAPPGDWQVRPKHLSVLRAEWTAR